MGQHICYRFWEDPGLSEERSIVQYCHRILYTHETCYANKNVLKKTYSKIRVNTCRSDAFPLQNGLKQGDALSPLLFNFALVWCQGRFKKMRKDWN
jgi:hypothetical protein